MSRKKEISTADMTIILEEAAALGLVVCIEGVWHLRENLPSFNVKPDRMLESFDEAFIVIERGDDE